MARDPAAYLLQLLEPYLPRNDVAVREQVSGMIAQTVQAVESTAKASAETERARAAEALRAAQQELQALRGELEATERNRAELAALLQATIATAQSAALRAERPEKDRRCGAAVVIQSGWRAHRVRRCRRNTRAGQHDPYDMIVCFNSLNSTIDPANLRISILHWAHSAFNIGIAQRDGIRIVAHMGLFDKGKTFLINELYGKTLPSGKLHETTGLSMVYVPEQRFLVIDTKGLQAPVSYKTKGVKQLVDASQTEIFLFELVSRIAHYIVFVVNDFTWPEQRHILQLHQKYVQSKRENQLIVAHNLRTTRSINEAVELFSKQVASKYEGVERAELGGLIFTVEEKPRIHHIGFAEAYSPAGLKFNAKNKQHILQLLDQIEGIGERQRSISELLQQNFAALLPEFVYLESDTGQRLDGSALQVVSEMGLDGAGPVDESEPDEERDPTVYKTIGGLSLQLPADHRAHMKTEGVFSEFCELVAQDVTFKPPQPNVYEQRLKDKILRLVEFEVPGVHAKDITFRKGNRGYTVIMARTKDKTLSNYGVAPKFQAPRNPTGEFSFDLFFDDGIWELDGGREAVDHADGVLRVRLKQDMEGEVFRLDEL